MGVIAPVVAISVGLVVVLIGRSVIPARYFIDGDGINQIALGHPPFVPDKSYAHTAAIYRDLGLAGHDTLTGLLILALLTTTMFIAVPWRAVSTATTRLQVFFVMTMALGGVYVCQYSKEAMVLPVVILLLTVPNTRVGFLIKFAGILAYAYEFRHYWFLVAAFYLVFLAIESRIRLTPPRLVVSAAVILALGVVAFHVVLGVPSGHFRDTVNQLRLGTTSVNTLIAPTPTTGLIPDLVGIFPTALSLVLPWPLRHAGLAYIGFGLMIAVGWCVIIRGGTRLIARGASTDGARWFLLLISFLLVQVYFEPDYGSYLKHLAPLLPLACAMLAKVDALQPADASEALHNGQRAHAPCSGSLHVSTVSPRDVNSGRSRDRPPTASR
jgi:hypothetical protein